MPETITVNLTSYPEDITVNLTTESSGVTANLVETTLTFLEGAGLYRENVFTQDNTFQKDVYVGENLTVAGTTFIPHISGNTALSGNLTVTGNESIIGNLSVTGGASVDNVTFDLTPELAGGVGIMRWDDVDGTLEFGLKGGNVTLPIGQKFVVRVVNKTGADLLGSQYKVARIRTAPEGGAQGQRLAVVLAKADNDADSVTTLGIVAENIGNNQEGFIVTSGQVKGLNTTGDLQGEEWEDGDVLYLSPTILGALTKVKPVAPQHIVVMGYVEYAHQNNGELFIKIDNGYELDELHNVRITDAQNAQVLTYDSLSGIWKNADPTGGGTSGAYLPLSGGTVNGFLTVTDSVNFDGGVNFNTLVSNDITLRGNNNVTLRATNLLGLSSANTININAPTVTFNATSGVSINGSLTASGIVTSPDFSLAGTVGGEFVASKNVLGWAFGNKTTPVLTNDSSPQGVFFKPDGTIMYTLGSGAGSTYRVYAYNVPTPWDVSTVSATATLSSVVIEASMQGLYFSPDGRYFFTLSQNRNVRRYQMAVGSEWNVSTGVLSGSFTLGASQTVNRGITFKPDGTEMYVFDDNTNFIYEYNLNPAWDVTTATLNLSAAFPDGTSDITISSDGTRLIAIATAGTFNQVVFEYTLPTPWNVTGAYFNGRMWRGTGSTAFPAGGPAVAETFPTGIYYNDTLNKCFFVGSNIDRVQEIIVTPQPAIIGTRPIIQSVTTNNVVDRVTMNSLQLTDTTNTNSSSTGALIVAGGISCVGNMVCGGGSAATTYQVGQNVFWSSSTSIAAPSNGVLRISNQAVNGFDRLQLGTSTDASPAIATNGASIDIRFASLTGALTDLRARNLTATGVISGSTHTSATNALLVNSSAGTDIRIQLGGTTASFPSIVRSGVGVAIRDATNTTYGDLQAANISVFNQLYSGGPVIFASYSAATPPTPLGLAGAMIYVTDEVDGATMAFCDGTDWRRVRDNVIISI